MRIRVIFCYCFLVIYMPLFAQVKLPQLIRDSMVLQRDSKINIWGWATAGEKVQVKFAGKKYKTTTDQKGKWTLELAPVKAGGPFRMEVLGINKIVLKDILVGDVWLCSGQSNMEHQMKLHDVIYGSEIAQANNPLIRQFKVPNTTNLMRPQTDIPSGNWKWANAENVRDFSAVAYFFAKNLFEKYKVPVGIINTSWGGSPIEAWMSEESLQAFPSMLTTIEKNKDTAYVNGINRRAVTTPLTLAEDKGLSEKWFDLSYQPKGWRNISVPGYWEDQGVKDLNGVVWYRKEIDLPESLVAKSAKIFLGRIVDADELYINGKRIGITYYMYPQRRYIVPKGLLKAGKNVLTVRVTNNNGKGGFVPDKPYQLIVENDTIDLTGYWQYKIGQVFYPQPSSTTITIQYQPTALYNAMLFPLMPYTIKGFVWYQGESNTGNPDEYAKLQPTMIANWRKGWNQEHLPFLFVQLPGFMDYSYVPTESSWAAFREAQAKSLTLPNTGMAITIDVGEWNDVHPDKKKEVGDRLAFVAQKTTYGENIIASGPVLKSFRVEGSKIVLSFNNADSGLSTSDGEPLSEFAIAGADKKFVWAKAIIRGNEIEVSASTIGEPKYVRYAWADNPVQPNLINKNGLPAAPFRTDK